MPEVCSHCNSENIIPYEPRLKNGRLLCLVCNRVFETDKKEAEGACGFGMDEDEPNLTLSWKTDVFETARVFTEEKVLEWFTEVSELYIKSHEREVVLCVKKLLELNEYKSLKGNYEINFRINYNTHCSSGYAIWIDRSGLKLRSVYFEKDDFGNNREIACFDNYPPKTEEDAKNIETTLELYSNALMNLVNKSFTIRAYDKEYSWLVV
ncbi:MAG: hypothetical protein EOO01_10245 [Chitinophagaceae bacterium]|nr:MAG: hypothetical protein EOO01_10245 [Chitinophagaceae bacterium]